MRLALGLSYADDRRDLTGNVRVVRDARVPDRDASAMHILREPVLAVAAGGSLRRVAERVPDRQPIDGGCRDLTVVQGRTEVPRRWIVGQPRARGIAQSVTTCGPDTFFMAVASCPRGLLDTRTLPTGADEAGGPPLKVLEVPDNLGSVGASCCRWAA